MEIFVVLEWLCGEAVVTAVFSKESLAKSYVEKHKKEPYTYTAEAFEVDAVPPVKKEVFAVSSVERLDALQLAKIKNGLAKEKHRGVVDILSNTGTKASALFNHKLSMAVKKAPKYSVIIANEITNTVEIQKNNNATA